MSLTVEKYMVVLKSSRAIGSFLGVGTHVWLEVLRRNGEKTTYSGSKVGKLLGVIRNYKRDFDKSPARGEVVIPPPNGVSEEEWDEVVLDSAEKTILKLHRRQQFCGVFPDFNGFGNCCTVATEIVSEAGGEIPRKYLKGLTPGLRMSKD